MPEPETIITPVDGAEEHAEEKVIFSEVQQAKLEEIVKKAEVSARAGAEARTEAARLQAELDRVKAQVTPPAEDVSLELATTKAELAAVKNAQTESSLKDSLRQAAGDTFIDAELGIRLMHDAVKIGPDGKPVVVGADGNPALNSAFEPMSLSELAQQIADQRKYLARGAVRPGTGAAPALNSQSNQPRLEDLFGAKSDGGAANRLAMRDPQQYRRLRELARSKGLVR